MRKRGKVSVFSTKVYDERFLTPCFESAELDYEFFETRLTRHTSGLAQGSDAVCVFVNDELDPEVLEALSSYGVKHIALRCAGFNNVDLQAAKLLGIQISRVPAYSPEAVAEHTFALISALNRKLYKAYNRVQEGNFSLKGLLGFNLSGKTVGIIGTGRIGMKVAQIAKGYGCKIVAVDPIKDPAFEVLGGGYVSLDELFETSDILTLHCPLTKENYHLINDQSLEKMKSGVMLINTSRGGLLDTKAVIKGLKCLKIGYLGLDVYEMESELFFEDKSMEIIQDDTFQRLQTFPNVLITGHQGFFTEEALSEIARVTTNNLKAFESGSIAEENLISI